MEKALGFDRDKTNVNGGAIALSHLLRAAAGGRGMAIIVESVA